MIDLDLKKLLLNIRAENTDELLDRVIYRCVIGSRAYGLDDDVSDTDRRGIFLPPADLHWSLGGVPEQIANLTSWPVPLIARFANTVPGVGTVVWEGYAPFVDRILVQPPTFTSWYHSVLL